ncbi:MAG: hypothetical protein ACLGG7_08670, partial [Bacteriovoracia bacterium]
FSQRPSKAPLFVFMPGIYGQPDSGLTPQFVDQLESLGGHVLVVPNLLAPKYVKAFPLYAEDPVKLEVQVLEEALSFALKELGERVQRVEVIAESLGTALGSAWSAHDRLHQKRIQSLTLLWPPLDLPRAMKNFDGIIDEHRAAHERCWTVEKLSILMRQFLFQTYPGAMTLPEQGCIGALVLVDGFVKATQRSWKAYNEVAPAPGEAPEGFEEYFRRYRPEFWKLISENDERLKLDHWMRVIRRDPNFVVRVMTSQDDFLNRGLDWQSFKLEHKLSDAELVVLDWGGHSGPVAAPEFFEVLRLSLSAGD